MGFFCKSFSWSIISFWYDHLIEVLSDCFDKCNWGEIHSRKCAYKLYAHAWHTCWNTWQYTVNTATHTYILWIHTRMRVLKQASGVKWSLAALRRLPVCVKQMLAERREGGGNNDSISTALLPQLRKWHWFKTYSENTDRKWIQLTGKYTALYQTSTPQKTYTQTSAKDQKINHWNFWVQGKYSGLERRFKDEKTLQTKMLCFSSCN